MHWYLSVMVKELMIRVIKLRRNLQTLHSWLSHPLPPIHLLTVRHSGLLSQPPMSVALPVPLKTNSPSKGLRRTKKTCFYAPMNHAKFPLHKVSAATPSKSQPLLTTAARPVS
nr:hypothetical protein [Tanacetum cinerariifolium]